MSRLPTQATSGRRARVTGRLPLGAIVLGTLGLVLLAGPGRSQGHDEAGHGNAPPAARSQGSHPTPNAPASESHPPAAKEAPPAPGHGAATDHADGSHAESDHESGTPHAAEDHGEASHGDASHDEAEGPAISPHIPSWILPSLLALWQKGPLELTGMESLSLAGAAAGTPLPLATGDGEVVLTVQGAAVHLPLPKEFHGKPLEARAIPAGERTVALVAPAGELDERLRTVSADVARHVEVHREGSVLAVFLLEETKNLRALGLHEWEHFHGDWIGLVNGELTLVRGAKVSYALQRVLPEHLAISLITIAWMIVLAFLLTRRLQRIPSRVQVVLEMIVTGFENFVVGIIGPHGKKYVPLAGTLFLYIWFMTLSGLIPGWLAPTSNINITAALALTVFVYVQFEGIRANGLIGYLKHFAGEPSWLAPINIPIHVIGELARPLSLSIRLFGNIFGEETVLAILIGIAALFVKVVPVHALLYPLVLFGSTVQALVFTMLTCVYLASVTAHHHAEGEHHQEHRAGQPAHGHA